MDKFIFNIKAFVSFISISIKEFLDKNATNLEVTVFEDAVKKEVIGTYRRMRVLKGFLRSCERLNIVPDIVRFESSHASYDKCLYMVNYVSNQEKKSIGLLKQGSKYAIFDHRLTETEIQELKSKKLI